MTKILLVEDEINIAPFIKRGLKELGYSVAIRHDGDTSWKILQDEPFDLLVLNIIIPKINGLKFCRLYRRIFRYQIPVVMLTVLGTTEDIARGLDAGIDDYLVKPFSFRELEACVKTLLRRNKEVPSNPLTCDSLVLDYDTRKVKRGDIDIDLTVKGHRLLEYFMTRQRVALLRVTLLRGVQDKNLDANTSIVDTYMNYLRIKIDRDFDKKLVHATVGLGYIMNT